MQNNRLLTKRSVDEFMQNIFSVQLPFRGPSEYKSRMLEKLDMKNQIQTYCSSQRPTVIVWRPMYLSNVIQIIHLRIYISQFPETDFVSGYCDIWAAAILVDLSPRWTRLWVSGELFWWAIHPADKCVCKRDRWTWAAYLFMVRPDNRLPHVWRALEPPPNCVCWPKPLLSDWNLENCTSIYLILLFKHWRVQCAMLLWVASMTCLVAASLPSCHLL